MLARATTSGVLTAAILSFASPSFAQGTPLDRARDAMQEADEHFGAGRFVAAAKAYARADRHVASAEAKQNEAVAWEKSGDLERAADAYDRALAMGTLGGDWVEDSRRRLEALRNRLGVIVVSHAKGQAGVAPVEATVVLGQRSRAVPTRLHVRPGAYTLTIKRDGLADFEKNVKVTVGGTIFVQAPAPPRPVTKPPAPEDDDPGQAQRIAGWTTLAVGGVASIAGLALSVRFLQLRSDYLDDTTNLDAEQRARDYQVASAATVWPGLGLAAIGTVLLLTAPSGSDVGVGISPTGANFIARW